VRKKSKFTPGVADSVLATLRCARDVYDAAVGAQASKLRAEFVEPLCRKYGWRYRSGMGTFFVCVDTGDNTYRPSTPDDTRELESLKEELSREAYDDLVALLKAVNTDVYSFCHGTDGNPVALLGYYVEDVD
jgi:hypothetical protein